MRPLLARAAAVLCAAALTGCATILPEPPSPAALLHDALFPSLEPAPDVSGLFAMSPAMKAFADTEIAGLARLRDPRRALIAALNQKGRLRLEYDSSTTRTAAEAFEARAGNCLSLVLMTAGFARHLGLPVSFQSVLSETAYSRSGQLHLASGHVNLVLGPSMHAPLMQPASQGLVVDFVPAEDLQGQRTRPLDEATVVAMFLNNRAAEALVDGQLAQAYRHARAALLHAPTFVNAANTLGVVYSRAGQLVWAEAAFRHTLASQPDHVGALGNLVQLLQLSGRLEGVPELQARLHALQPVAPFFNFSRGQAAMQAGRFEEAAAFFDRELRLQPDQDEVHFWAAQARLRLGQAKLAGRHLQRAVEFSRTLGMKDRYNAKLERLRESRPL